MMERIDSRFFRNLVDKTVLFYASSTRYYEQYLDLPFDYIILCNYEYFNQSGMRLFNNKVIEWPSDNNRALRVLMQAGVKIDCFVGIQDGCIDGGNYECVSSNSFFARLSPVLKDNVIYITNHWDAPNHQYTENVVHTHGFLNNHFTPLASFDELPYVDPAIKLSEHERDDSRKFIIPIKRKDPNTIEAKVNRINIAASNASVWDFEKDFDCIVHPPYNYQHRGGHQTNKYKNPFVFNHRERDFRVYKTYQKDPVLLFEDAVTYKWKNIATVPFLQGRYDEFLEICKNWDERFPEKIHFFHLEDRDLGQLRLRLEQQTH
jgi:hypothetical protein